jgi:hypothetical protein
MTLDTNYWTLLLSNGGVVSLLGMIIYFIGLALVVAGPIQHKSYVTAGVGFIIYTTIWLFSSFWWTA